MPKFIELTDINSGGKISINPEHIVAIENLVYPNQKVIGAQIRFVGSNIVGQVKETKDEIVKLINPLYRLNRITGEFELL